MNAETEVSKEIIREETKRSTPTFKGRLYLFAGFLSVSIGLLGIILPILDTTPFMLLGAFCFARSSQKWHRWLVNHPLFGPYISAFREKRGLTLKQKRRIACTTTLMLSVTAFFGPASHGPWIALAAWLPCMAWLVFSHTAEDDPNPLPIRH